MTTPNKYSPENNVPSPRCPHCAYVLNDMATFQWTTQLAIGLGMLLCMYCPNPECRKILGTQILVIPHAREESAIVGPH